ncbi:hypothetical protein LEMLEM_LOCUS12678 [Lemmus lemmus]
MLIGFGGSFLTALLTVTQVSLLGWFHALSVALLGRYPTALAFGIELSCNQL